MGCLALYKGNKLGLYDKSVIGELLSQRVVLAFNSLVDRVSQDVFLSWGVPAGSLGEMGDKAIDVSASPWVPYQKTGVADWTANTAIDNGSNAFRLITAKR